MATSAVGRNFYIIICKGVRIELTISMECICIGSFGYKLWDIVNYKKRDIFCNIL